MPNLRPGFLFYGEKFFRKAQSDVLNPLIVLFSQAADDARVAMHNFPSV